MPKLKTKKGLAKRFRVNKNGRIKRMKAGRRHLLGKKSGKRKRLLRKMAMVPKSHAKMIKAWVPVK